MNALLNTVLKDYLLTSKTEYAYLITGEWGSGKTFYIRNEFSQVTQKLGYSIIYFSLNGVNSIDAIKENVIIRYLIKQKKPNYNLDVIENVITIGQLIPKVDKIIQAVIAIKGSAIEKITDKINFSKTVIVFDDLERLGVSIKAKDVIGTIYENFIKAGVKTIFIANEEKIDDIEFKEMKEKYFRRVLRYAPEIRLLIASYLKSKYSASKHYYDIASRIDIISLLLSEKREKNLRTVAFVMDLFIHVLENMRSKNLKENIDRIFINIAIISFEFKLGHLNTADLMDSKKLNQISFYPILWNLDKKKEEEKEYHEIFYELYNQKLHLGYFYLKSVFDYVLTGYLDIALLENEMESIFSDNKEEWDKAVDVLKHTQEIEQDELIRALNNVVEYLKNGKYQLMSIANIYTIFRFIEDEKYLEKWPYDNKEIFREALIASSEKKENVPDDPKHLFGFHEYDNRKTNEPMYLEIKKYIEGQASRKKLEKIKTDIVQLFKSSIISDNDFWSIFRKMEHSKVFASIVDTGSVELFLSLNNYGIENFQSIIHSDILNISNAGEYGYDQKEKIQIICEYLEKEVPLLALNNMRKKRFFDLIRMMKKAMNHLDTTRTKK